MASPVVSLTCAFCSLMAIKTRISIHELHELPLCLCGFDCCI